MKKIVLFFVGLLSLATVSNGQAISDNIVIPMGITVNSIMRISVIKGGNIEFVFNTFADFTNGINAGMTDLTRYGTVIDVASTVKMSLTIQAETATFMGNDVATNTLPLNVIHWKSTGPGTNLKVAAFGADLPLTNAAAEFAATDVTTATSLGPVNISFSCGAPGSGTVIGAKPDRYSTNVLLRIVAMP